MAPTKPKGNGRLAWTFEMRLVVHLCTTEFGADGQERARIFHTIFAEDITACGLPAAVISKRIKAQYAKPELKQARWVVVLAPPETAQEEAIREELRAKIRAVITPTRPLAPLSARKRPQSSALPSSSQRTPTSIRAADNAQGEASDIFQPRNSATRNHRTTPLSKRPAIATWAPESLSLSADEDDELSMPCAKRRRLELNEQPRALVPVISRQQPLPQVELPTPPKTPSKKQKKAITKAPKTPAHRNDGTIINVGDKIRERMKLPLASVSEQQVHPPMPGVFFRCYDRKTPRDHNSEDWMWARVYHKSNVIDPRPPRASEISHFEIYNHIDKKPPGTPLIPSKFISVSSGLIWLLRKSRKQTAKGDTNQTVSVISSQALNPKAVFWVPPLHRSTLPPAPYHGAAQYYGGTLEWLCWRDIPGSAIIRTFSFNELKTFCQTHPAVGNLLRLGELLNGTYHGMRRNLKLQKVPLDLNASAAIAQLAVFMGLDAQTSTAHLSTLVHEVVHGWCLHVAYHTEKEWQALASAFSQALSSSSQNAVEDGRQIFIEQAFLEGVFWSCGDVNPKTTKEKAAKVARKASSIGLSSPSQLMARKLDSIKMALLMDAKAGAKRINNYFEQLSALTSGEDGSEPASQQDYYEVEEYDSDEDLGIGPSRQPRLHQRLTERAHNEDDEDENMIVFGSDGRVL